MRSFLSNKETSTSQKRILSNLVIKREWSKLQKIVSYENSLAKDSVSSISTKCCQSQDLFLLACGSNPPTDIFDSLLKMFPSAVYKPNCDGKLPLHVACEFGASPAIIQKLLKANKNAVLQQDKFGMLPIHIACRCYYENTSPWIPEDIQAYNALRQIITDLLEAGPTTILEVDCNKKCPIEYAIESDTHIEIINGLRDFSKNLQSHL